MTSQEILDKMRDSKHAMEIAEWKQAREKIKRELPMTEREPSTEK